MSKESWELGLDRYCIAHLNYLQRRHEIALKLLAWHDHEVFEDQKSKAEEESLRDRALVALAGRKYVEAAECTRKLSEKEISMARLQARRHTLRVECDRLCAARDTMEERLKLLAGAPSTIDDPHIHDVTEYLTKRQETALRLIAAIDALLEQSPSDHDASVLRRRRDVFKS